MRDIILFNANDRQREILSKLAFDNNISIREISMEDLDQKVGFLVGLDGFEKNSLVGKYDSKYDFTFMLFKDFDNKEIFSFINLMKEEGLNIDHKAALTDKNIHWTLRFLLDENDDEHKTMLIINEINSLVKKAHDHKKIHGENPYIKNLVDEINEYFSNPNGFDLNVAKEYKEKLKDEVSKLS